MIDLELPIPGKDPVQRWHVWAPNGDNKEVEGWFIFGANPDIPSLLSPFVVKEDMTMEKFGPRVVIRWENENRVVYNPRVTPQRIRRQGGPQMLTYSDHKWLDDNKHWPAILELEGNGDEHEET